MHATDVRRRLAPVVLAACLGGPALAQLAADNPDWRETDAPPPPALNLQRLVPFDMGVVTSLRYGIDPDSLQVGRDGVVRYVVVASSDEGALNAMYEGIRCATGEVKTYARYNTGDKRWAAVAQPEWRTVFNSAPVRHARALAAKGICNGNAPGLTPATILRDIKGQNPTKTY